MVGALDSILARQLYTVVLFPERLELVDGVGRQKAHALSLPHPTLRRLPGCRGGTLRHGYATRRTCALLVFLGRHRGGTTSTQGSPYLGTVIGVTSHAWAQQHQGHFRLVLVAFDMHHGRLASLAVCLQPLQK